MKSRCIVLFSGGQDSTTCLYLAKSKFDSVICVSFSYGQRHSIEIEQSKKICEIAGVEEHLIVDLNGLLGNSSLVGNPLLNVDEPHSSFHNLPSSFVPARNLLFLSVAFSFAMKRNISDIFTGVCQTDYSGYPDCRSEFIESMQKSMNLSIDSNHVRIHTPLLFLTKAEIWKLSKDLGCIDVIINHTHTDYNGDRSIKNDWGYGNLDNNASRLRAKGFYDAKEKGWI